MISAPWQITQQIAGTMFVVEVVDVHKDYETEISASQAWVHCLGNTGGEVIPDRGILLW